MNSHIKLTDIIDLDYLIHIDQEENSQPKALRNRDICRQYALEDKDDRTVLLAWLTHQRKVFHLNAMHRQDGILPSDMLILLYRWMIILLTGFGFFSGVGAVVSFLTYQGDIPVNVTVFMVMFMVLPLLVLLSSIFWLIFKQLKKGFSSHVRPGNSFLSRGISWLWFEVLPQAVKKMSRLLSGSEPEKAEFAMRWVRLKVKEYHAAFFWPFFMLLSLTGLSFSMGMLTGTLFKILISDVAFGWQSTMISSGAGFHSLISAVSFPWSWWVPEALSHPSLEQIEGTRIILKDGMAVLATTDLVSWWPFLCFGLLCYGILPRIIVTMFAFIRGRKILDTFDFDRPRYRELIIGIKSPLMDIDSVERPDHDVDRSEQNGNIPQPAGLTEKDNMPGKGWKNTLVLASEKAYPREVLSPVDNFLKRFLANDTYRMLYIQFDFQKDAERLLALSLDEIDRGIILHEIWQPPIRGVLHYLDRLQKEIFTRGHLWILLTQEPREGNLTVSRDDINYKVWEKAILGLGNPGIDILRYHT